VSLDLLLALRAVRAALCYSRRPLLLAPPVATRAPLRR